MLEDVADGGAAFGQLRVALQPGALPEQARHLVRDILLEVVEDGELRHGTGFVRHAGGGRELGEIPGEVAQHVKESVRVAALSLVE